MDEPRRLLVLGLDGYEESVGRALMADGRLPNLRHLRDSSVRFELDHGVEIFSGLTWEHFSTGHSPSDGGPWSAIHFDANTSEFLQMPTERTPFLDRLPVRTVVFDCPYLDIGKVPSVQGVVGWGAHDSGVPTQSQPPQILSEMTERFGEFAGHESLYGFSWPSAARTESHGRLLAAAARQRSDVAHWLLSERLPDWELALIVMGEFHSAVEPFWHGWDSTHPLHSLPSAAPAGRALAGVYDAVDEMVGALTDAFPDASVLAFAMHGMGPNQSDVPSMVLLPELLYRDQFGHPLLEARTDWETSEIPMLAEDEPWSPSVVQQLRHPNRRWAAVRRRMRPASPAISEERRARSQSVDWIPAARYRRYWPDMEAFAIPAYYHGRIRINLRGREAREKVRPEQYERACAALTTLLEECRNPETGRPAVKSVRRFVESDPLLLGETDADLEVIWEGAPISLDHPVHGRIGPVPHRRTGGHTGDHGIAWLNSPAFEPEDRGRRSSFDVVPTVFDLLGRPTPEDLSGHSLLQPAD